MWDAIKEAESWQFAYGSTDCCAFVAHVLKAITGIDYMCRFPAYDSEFGAARIFAKHGGYAGIMDSVFKRIPVLQASRGDVVLVGDEVGICVGTAVACMTKQGIHYRPIHEAMAAWAKQ
jgi:hypothetical protein